MRSHHHRGLRAAMPAGFPDSVQFSWPAVAGSCIPPPEARPSPARDPGQPWRRGRGGCESRVAAWVPAKPPIPSRVVVNRSVPAGAALDRRMDDAVWEPHPRRETDRHLRTGCFNTRQAACAADFDSGPQAVSHLHNRERASRGDTDPIHHSACRHRHPGPRRPQRG